MNISYERKCVFLIINNEIQLLYRLSTKSSSDKLIHREANNIVHKTESISEPSQRFNERINPNTQKSIDLA